MQTMMRRIAIAVAAAGMIAAAGSAEAGLITFSYNGQNVFPGSTGTTTGVGSFEFAGSSGVVTLPNLTGFSYMETVTASGPGIPLQTTTFRFGLADLTSFAALVGTDGVPTVLNLMTRPVPAANPAVFAPESFTITSLEPGGAATFNAIGQKLTQGTVISPAAAPEPSTLAGAFLASLTGLGYAWKRRRAA